MSEEMNMPEELRELERGLAGLRPAGGGLDRDCVMFEAGRVAGVRAGKKRMRVWQGVCGVLVAGCVGLVMLPRERVVEKVVVREEVKPLVQEERRVAEVPPAVVPRAPEGVEGDEGLMGSLMGMRRAALGGDLSEVLKGGGGGGGGGNVPALKPGDGLDALPQWQRRAANGGNRS